jgi:DNA-binding NtrC family response regulator
VQSGLSRLAEQLAIATPAVGDDFYEALTDHAWPGNVRELMNLLERVLVQTRAAVLRGSDLEGLLDFEPAADQVLDAPLDEDDEAGMIRAALLDTGGNVTRAARRLGIPRGTLRYKIRRYGLGSLIPSD